MQLRAFLFLLFCHIRIGLALHEHVKRGAETNATLYAYGTNSSAWPIAYGLNDGLLYVAENPENSDANLTPLTWDLASITGECWIANATFVNGTRAGCMYIMPEDEYAVGVLPMTRVAYLNGTVSGFALFASQLVYNNNTLLEAQFWAKSTEYSGVYGLTWTIDDSAPSGDFPVVVKASEDS
ncbi:hypothetical protein N7462_001263 [Penicillium macrosclerotiorum]|uniref:uncharacterized protein n=1 Tax=Penicillium macrosclerotiorum TaxID=303699 RepID=UPI002548F8A7|nr:uncharacterized protein N7462_001263 [Penicillium macrosclerotiorum]KAJ5691840.1 hypothetical protein N7462_001263 [Penicillium macrosclerotiorum]